MISRTYYAIRPTDALLETMARLGINGEGVERALLCKGHHDRLPRSPDSDLEKVKSSFLKTFCDYVQGRPAPEFSLHTFDKYWVVDVYSDVDDVDEMP